MPAKKLTKLKSTRKKQWNTKKKTPRGWDTYRSTTFLETVGAKIDRAIIAIELYQKNKEKGYHADAIDSIYDAKYYLEELIKITESNPNFLIDNGMR